METDERAEWELLGKNIRGEVKRAGDRFGHFTVLDVRCMSLFGVTYEAKDRNSEERVCLHLFPTGLTSELGTEVRLGRAVEQLRAVTEESVLTPREFLKQEGVLGIAFEDCSGARSLTRYVEESGGREGLAAEEVKRLLGQVATAIRAAADAGLHHYALTPECVLIAGGSVKVFGFGFYEAVERRRLEAFISGAIVPIKRAIEAPGYSSLEVMSPELRNQQDADVRADIHALGVLAYYLLTHRRPTFGRKLAEVGQGLSAGWEHLIGRCLEPEPKNRYPTGGAFLLDLERVESLGSEEALHRSRLSRVPLPGAWQRRTSARVQDYLRLGLLGLTGCLAVGTGSIFYQLIFIEDIPVETVPLAEALPDQKANLVLRVETPAARVRVAGQPGILRPRDGELRLRGAFRDYMFTVEAPQHLPERFSVALNAQPQERRVALDLEWAGLRLEGPPGSRIDVTPAGGQTVFLDMIPESGIYVSEDRLLAGTYQLEVRRPGYAPQGFVDVSLSGKDWTELVATLEPLPASLRVVSEPPGATVRLNGERVGRTPLLLSDLSPTATFTVTVEGAGRRVREETLELAPGQENLLDFGELEATTGTVDLRISLGGETPVAAQLEPLELRLGEERFQGLSRLQRAMPAGRHSLLVEHPDYFPVETELRLEDQETVRQAIDLRPRPGRLRLRLPDAAYRVFLDGEPVDPVGGELELPPGREVVVTLAVRNHFPIRRSLRLQPNALEEWEPVLQALPGPEQQQAWTVPNLGLAMPWVEPDTYLMGSPPAEQMRLPNEGPPTRMRISRGFWVGATEVTQATYRRVMGENPSYYLGDARPVESVSWGEAVAFARRITTAEREAGRLPEGYVYRLPTEAEWEYFTRAGSDAPFATGDRITAQEANLLGQYPLDYGSTEIVATRSPGTTQVGAFAPNAWGLHDLHGNVSEWTLDGYNDRLPGGEAVDFHRAEGRGRAIRGGAWDGPAHRARASARDSVSEGSRRPSLGFRLVLAPAFGAVE